MFSVYLLLYSKSCISNLCVKSTILSYPKFMKGAHTIKTHAPPHTHNILKILHNKMESNLRLRYTTLLFQFTILFPFQSAINAFLHILLSCILLFLQLLLSMNVISTVYFFNINKSMEMIINNTKILLYLIINIKYGLILLLGNIGHFDKK